MQRRPSEIPPPKLITALGRYDLLPAIVFLPTRRKCDEAAMAVAADRSQRSDPSKAQIRKRILEEFAVISPEVADHKHAQMIVTAGVASHHAGHIPTWKLVIERMMADGLLNAIFATTTVAAGVDFPARTVVISNADTRGNDGWRPLRASELQQMTGRAGRRGKDKVGFVVLVPGQFQDPAKIAELLKAPPEPLESQFRATYTSLLNLLDAFGAFAPVREIAEKSFAFRSTRHRIDEIERRREGLVKKLAETGVELDDIRGFERLASALDRVQHAPRMTRDQFRHDWLRDNVIPGRVVTQGRNGKRLFVVLNLSGEKVTAMRDDGLGTSFELARVNRIYDMRYDLSGRSIEKAFFDVYDGRNQPLDEPRPGTKPAPDEAIEVIMAAMTKVAGPADGERHRKLTGSVSAAETLERLGSDIETMRDGIWRPFHQKACVLEHFGYLDLRREIVLERGKWLADLRLDRPLIVGEAIRRGVFSGSSPSILAGLVASIASDPDRSYGELYVSRALLDKASELDRILDEVGDVELENGVEPVEALNSSAAAVAERWAEGWVWEKLVDRTNAEEGDLVRLLSRTGEALLQISKLRGENHEVASIAASAAETVLREPVR